MCVRGRADTKTDSTGNSKRGEKIPEVSHVSVGSSRCSEASAASAEKRIKAAEAEHIAASAEYNDIWIKYKSRYRTQAAAFVAAGVARERLVMRELRKTALTEAANVAEQTQKQRQQRRAAVQRQQIEQQVVEADTPAT